MEFNFDFWNLNLSAGVCLLQLRNRQTELTSEIRQISIYMRERAAKARLKTWGSFDKKFWLRFEILTVRLIGAKIDIPLVFIF